MAIINMFTLTARASTLDFRKSDAYRSQILTTKVDARAVRVKSANISRFTEVLISDERVNIRDIPRNHLIAVWN